MNSSFLWSLAYDMNIFNFLCSNTFFILRKDKPCPNAYNRSGFKEIYAYLFEVQLNLYIILSWRIFRRTISQSLVFRTSPQQTKNLDVPEPAHAGHGTQVQNPMCYVQFSGELNGSFLHGLVQRNFPWS